MSLLLELHQTGRQVIILHLGVMYLKHNQRMDNKIKIEVGEEEIKDMVEDINRDIHSKDTHNKDTHNKGTHNRDTHIRVEATTNNNNLCTYNNSIVVVQDKVV